MNVSRGFFMPKNQEPKTKKQRNKETEKRRPEKGDRKT